MTRKLKYRRITAARAAGLLLLLGFPAACASETAAAGDVQAGMTRAEAAKTGPTNQNNGGEKMDNE